MKNINTYLFLLTAVLALTLDGCEIKDKPSWSDLTTIVYEETLKQNNERYYVIFYSNTCSYCEELLPVIIAYDKKEEALPIYILNTDDKKNNDGIMAKEDYQYFSFIGTENYYDIILENVPAMIIVEDGKIENLISSQTTDKPKTEIEYLLSK